MYIAYADMMAKVLVFFFALTQSLSVQQNPAGESTCALFQSCAEGEEEEDEEGKEKTFEVPVISQERCFAFVFVYFVILRKVLPSNAGKGNGEAKDAVPASPTA